MRDEDREFAGRVWGMTLHPGDLTLPADDERVELLRSRYERGLDLYSGRPLTGRNRRESEFIRQIEREELPCPTVVPTGEARSAYELFKASLRDVNIGDANDET